jgi:hypothetical protein
MTGKASRVFTKTSMVAALATMATCIPLGATAAHATATAVADGGGLSWAPPVLRSPVVMRLADGTGSLKLSTAQDYVLQLPVDKPAYLPQGLSISGGHNVVVVGGQVDVRSGYKAFNGEATRRGMYLKGQTGTVFIEGVRFSSTTAGTLTEGIDLDERLGAQVVLQNVRIDHLQGSYATNHADGLQTWAGPRRLLIDGLSMTTDYQGMFLLPNQHFTGPAPELFDLRNISIIGQPGSGYMIWKDNQKFPINIHNVYVKPGSHTITDRGSFLWPKTEPLLNPVIATTQPPAVATTAGMRYSTSTAGVGDTAPTGATGTVPVPGATSAPTAAPTVAPTAASTNSATLYRVNAGGQALSATPGWTTDTTGSASRYTNAAAAYSTTSSTTAAIALTHSSVPAGTPMALFQTERYDVSKGAAMNWTFPVAKTGTYAVRLYFAETYAGAWKVGGRVFNVYANGKLALDHEDVYAEAGKNAGLVKTIIVPVTGTTISLDFKPITQNPMVQGIEIAHTS